MIDPALQRRIDALTDAEFTELTSTRSTRPPDDPERAEMRTYVKNLFTDTDES